jgi:hypothetical protein
MPTKRVLFIHHSVGRGVLMHGEVRTRLNAIRTPVQVELYDHDYNQRGLTGPDGRRLGRAFPIPDDNTDPPGLKKLFDVALNDATLRSELKDFDLVIVKSCFPNSRIESDSTLEALRGTYAGMLARAEELDIPLAICTTPPVRTGRIDAPAARRAARMAEWLVAQEAFVGVFDLFAHLADTDANSDTFGMLRRSYTNSFLIDSHPTREASRSVGEPFARFILDTAARATRKAA